MADTDYTLSPDEQEFVDSLGYRDWGSRRTIDAELATKLFTVTGKMGEERGRAAAREVIGSQSDEIFNQFSEFKRTKELLQNTPEEQWSSVQSTQADSRGFAFDDEATDQQQGLGLDAGPLLQMQDPRLTYGGASRMATMAVLASRDANKETFKEAVKTLDVKLALDEKRNYRLEAINQELEEGVAKVNELVEQGETNEDVLKASVDFVMKTRADQDKYLMEKRAVDHLMNFADDNPDWRDLKTYYRPALEQAALDNKKKQIIRSFLDEKKAIQDDSHWLYELFDDTGELLMTLVGDDILSPLRARGWNFDSDTLLYMGKEIQDLPIEKLPQALEDFYSTMESKSGLVFDDEEDALTYSEAAFGTAYETSDLDTALAIETVLTIPFAAAVRGVSKLFGSTGNTSVVADDAIKAIANKDAADTMYNSVDDAVEGVMPISPNYNIVPGLSETVVRRLEATEKALEEAKVLPNMARLTPEEAVDGAKRRVTQLEKIYGKNQIVSGVPKYNHTAGIYEFEVLIGKRDGVGYATEGAARNQMSKSNIQGEVVQGETGFFIKQVQPITETLADNGLTSFKKIGVVKRFVQAPKAWVDNFLGNHGTTAAYNEARATGVVKDLYNRNIQNLNTQKFKEISEVLDVGLNEVIDETTTGKWYSPDELSIKFRQLHGKDIEEDQIVAYYTAKQISDFGHYVQNRAIYQEKSAKGLETINLSFIKQGPFEGNVYTAGSQLPKIQGQALVFNAAKNVVEQIDGTTLAKMMDEGYVVIRPEVSDWTIDEFGTGASYIITKQPKSIKISPLEYSQLPYAAGGRREYTDKFFIGQRRSGTFQNGVKYLRTPAIFRTAATPLEAQKWVDDANYAMEILKDNSRPLDEADALLMKHTGKGYDHWKEASESEGWDLNTKFEYKRDREDFPVDYEMRDAVRMYNPEAFESEFGVHKGNRLSSRGTQLKNVAEEDAQIYDFMGSLTRATDRAIKMGVYNDFRMTAINRFNTAFRKYIDDADRKTPYEVATKGTIDEGLRKSNPALYNAIKGHQFYINSLLRNRGTWDEMVQGALDSLANMIEARGGKLGKKISTKMYQGDGNPIESLRSLNYDVNLGMFNPKQFLLQANSVLTAIGLDPKNGLAAAKEVPMLRYALIADNPSLAKYFNKEVKDFPENTDLEKSMLQFKRLGFHDFGANIAMMDAQNTLGATTNKWVNRRERVREAGRIFFQEGERYGRLTAYSIARRRYKDKFPGSDEYSVDADNWIRLEADRLLLSPNSDNNPLLTKGVASIPTQFWSYMMKMADVVFTGSGGRYTWQERSTLLGSQVLLYGSAGIPATDFLLEKFEEETGTVFDPVMAKALHNGLIDTSIFLATGGEVDTDFSNSAGLGGFISQMVKTAVESPIPTLLGGATGSNLAGTWEAIDNTAKLYGTWENPNPEAVTMTALAGLGSFISSVGAVTKSYLAYNTGVWYDKHGRALADATKGEAVAAVLGLNPQAVADTYAIASGNKKAKEKFVSEVVPLIQSIHEKYNRAETEAEKKHLQEMLNALAIASKETGWWGDVAYQFNSFARSRTYQESLEKTLAERYLGNKEGANPNYLPRELREQLLREKE